MGTAGMGTSDSAGGHIITEAARPTGSASSEVRVTQNSAYLPVAERPSLGVEGDGYLDYGEAAEGEPLGVVPEVDLLHGGVCGGVYFQFYDVERGSRAQDCVYTSFRGADLDVHVVSEQGEYDVEHLLVVALVGGVVCVRDCGQEGLEGTQGSVHIPFTYRLGEPGHCGRGLVGKGLGHVIGQKGLHQSGPDFFVGYVQQVELGVPVIVLDGDISALVQ